MHGNFALKRDYGNRKKSFDRKKNFDRNSFFLLVAGCDSEERF